MHKLCSPRHFLKYCVVTLGFAQLGFFSPQAHAVLPVPTRPTSFPLSPVSYTTPGTVVGWGNNGNGQATIPGDLSNVVQVAAGYYHSLALKSDGTVVGWGYDGYGQATIPVGLSNVVQVSAGDSHSLALQSDGTVVGWGLNAVGQTTIPVGLSNVVQVAGGRIDHSLALKSDGTVVGWGFDVFGQATIPVGLSNVFQVSAGAYHNLALIPLSQTIGSFATIPTKMYGSAPFTVTAPAATSGLTVVLSVVSGPATISGNTVTLTGAGTVVLAANQAGNGSYSAASQVTTSFQVNMGSQSIAKFSKIADQKRKTSFALNVPRASSGLTVTVKVRSGPATIANNRITTTGPGIVVLEASQSGNRNYTAAVPVTCKFVVK